MFVKICCIASIDEARLAIGAGASAIGLVSAMPSGPGPIEEPEIARIAAAVPPPTETFLLTALTDAEAIAAQRRRCGTTAVQLVDALEEAELRRLRRLLPATRLVQVIHVTGPESVDEAQAAAPLVDTLLLDSGNPKLAVKELGGTGRVHDWETSRRIRDSVGVPVLLAGGLHPGNAREALERVRPAGLDVCSGLRPNGRLDASLLRGFFEALH
ncbi:MAG TPA: phosphoribosylanthranilate isomerase [Steroidobacteraceae bacterium]|nr:phosphoribosylanthranilate isomerase [Steroidobacteraceae bacterium]